VLWNVALLSLSLVVLALLADRQRLFLANLVLAGLLAFNAAWFLVVLRLRTVGYLLIVLTGLDVLSRRAVVSEGVEQSLAASDSGCHHPISQSSIAIRECESGVFTLDDHGLPLIRES